MGWAYRRRLLKLLPTFLDGKAKQPDVFLAPSYSGHDFLTHMLADGFTHKEIVAQMNHIYGAHKASGFMIAVCLYLLTRHPSHSTRDSKWANAIRDETAEVRCVRSVCVGQCERHEVCARARGRKCGAMFKHRRLVGVFAPLCRCCKARTSSPVRTWSACPPSSES